MESAPAVSEDSEFRVRPGKAKRSKAQGRNARGLVAELGPAEMHRRLSERDAATAGRLKPSDRQRIAWQSPRPCRNAPDGPPM